MVRNKLSEQDQQAMVRLYRESNLTATILAEYYEVSPSTITRLLKEAIPESEYQELVSQKRSLARRKDVPEIGVDQVDQIWRSLPAESAGDLPPEPEENLDLADEIEVEADEDEDEDIRATPSHQNVLVGFSREGEDPEADDEEEDESDYQTVLIGFADDDEPEAEEEDEDSDWDEPEPQLNSTLDPAVLHDLEEEIHYSSQVDLEDEDEDDTDEEYDEDEDDYDEDESPAAVPPEQIFEILPLEDLEPPSRCYVVVDRFDELTTRPLKDFMPTESTTVDRSGISAAMASQARTLPIFDDQRVARRFSQMSKRGNHPSQRNRVIEFPGYLLDIVRSQLQSKGITHLLVDGQVYSL